MKAIQAFERDRFYFEARQYIEQHGLLPDDLERISASLRHRAYLEAIKPVSDQIAKIHSNATGVTFIYRADELPKTEWRQSPEQQKAIDSLLDLLAVIREEYYPGTPVLPSA